MPENTTIQQAQQYSVTTRQGEGHDVPGSGFDVSVLWWLAAGDTIVAPYWSRRRDRDLRGFWRKGDHLAGAVYTLQSKLTAIPFTVTPRDATVKGHQAQAERARELLVNAAQMGKGWTAFLGPFVEDLITQDNGAFAEVIGAGRPDGPLVGMPISLQHLDAARCTRTSDPEFPVVYEQASGKKFKLHFTRVVALSQMPAPLRELNNVGFCAVSRAINTAQNLIDIATYKQEKLGSRPPRQILLGKGISDQDIIKALKIANAQMDNEALRVFAKTVAMGDPRRTDIELEVIDLTSVPDGFDEQTAITLGMFTIALAFGVDARELWPATASGATKADAMIQHLKARGKAPGQIIGMVEREMNTKVLPPYLRFEFDFQDDEQDEQTAAIREKRSTTRGRELLSKTVTVRVAREQMRADGDLTDEQFEMLELEDGRLEDGTDVLVLFFSPDEDFQTWLNLGSEDVLDPESNDPAVILPQFRERRRELMRLLAEALSREQATGRIGAEYQHKLRQALAALAALEQRITQERERQIAAEAGALPVGEGPPIFPPQLRFQPQGEEKETGVPTVPFDVYVEKAIEEFRRGLRAAVRGYWNGAFTRDEFEDACFTSIYRRYTEAWQVGAAQCGIAPGEYTDAERARLTEMIYNDADFIAGLGDAVAAGSKANGGKLSPLFRRLALWENRYNAVKAEAQASACADQKLKWVLGPTKEHCSSCSRLAGKVKRASQWQIATIRPQSRDLKCGGWRCLCQFEVTNEPMSKGPLPKLKERAHA